MEAAGDQPQHAAVGVEQLISFLEDELTRRLNLEPGPEPTINKIMRSVGKQVHGRPGRTVQVLDGATILDFVADESSFNSSVDDRFASLDANKDGLISYAEMVKEHRTLRLLATIFGFDDEVKPSRLRLLYGSLFTQFGAVDGEEFRAETRKVMLAAARGLVLPAPMVLEEGSFLKRAVERESTKFSRLSHTTL